jgi:hypothetical protein
MRVRVAIAAALAVVAIGSVAFAWLDGPPDLTASDAVTAAEDAFAAAGLDAAVDRAPVRTTYVADTSEPVEVWSVQATVRREPIELQLARSGARPVSMDDRTLDGSAYVLSELEYASVARHVDDPALARSIRRNVAVTAAAVLIVGLALAHAAIATKEHP